jgi:hypothetical protein
MRAGEVMAEGGEVRAEGVRQCEGRRAAWARGEVREGAGSPREMSEVKVGDRERARGLSEVRDGEREIVVAREGRGGKRVAEIERGTREMSSGERDEKK